MEILFDKECEYMKSLDPLDEIIQAALNKIVEMFKVVSLEKIVITHSEHTKYHRSIEVYCEEIDNDITTSSGEYTGVGILIKGVDKKGIFKQNIFLKEMIYLYLKEYFLAILEEREVQDLASQAYQIVLHEIGHGIDEENRYNRYKDIPSKSSYNLRLELKEYVSYEMLQLWSEYFAQRLVYIVCEDAKPTNIEEIKLNMRYLDCTNLLEKNQILYRLLYYFVLAIGYYHEHDEEVVVLNDEEIVLIAPILRRVEVLFKQLYQAQFVWDYPIIKDKLCELYIELLQF